MNGLLLFWIVTLTAAVPSDPLIGRGNAGAVLILTHLLLGPVAQKALNIHVLRVPEDAKSFIAMVSADLSTKYANQTDGSFLLNAFA